MLSLTLTFAFGHILAAALAAGAVWRPLCTVWHVSCASERQPGSLWRTPSESEEKPDWVRQEVSAQMPHEFTFQSKSPVVTSWQPLIFTLFVNSIMERKEIKSPFACCQDLCFRLFFFLTAFITMGDGCSPGCRLSSSPGDTVVGVFKKKSSSICCSHYICKPPPHTHTPCPRSSRWKNAQVVRLSDYTTCHVGHVCVKQRSKEFLKACHYSISWFS